MQDETSAANGKPDIITDMVVGLSDGLIIPFVLVAGLCGAALSNHAILIVAGTGVVFNSLAMALGRYYGGKEEAEHHQLPTPEQLQREQEILSKIGLGQDIQHAIVNEAVKDKEQWEALAATYELNPQPDPGHERKSAFNIAIFFALGGMLPLIPFILNSVPSESIKWSALITIVSLFAFGFIKAKLSSLNPWKEALRLSLTGAVAAWIAFYVATLFA